MSWRLWYVLDFFTCFSAWGGYFYTRNIFNCWILRNTVWGKPSQELCRGFEGSFNWESVKKKYCIFCIFTSSALFFAYKKAADPLRSEKLFLQNKILLLIQSTSKLLKNLIKSENRTMLEGRVLYSIVLLILRIKWSKQFDGDWGQLSFWHTSKEGLLNHLLNYNTKLSTEALEVHTVSVV